MKQTQDSCPTPRPGLLAATDEASALQLEFVDVEDAPREVADEEGDRDAGEDGQQALFLMAVKANIVTKEGRVKSTFHHLSEIAEEKRLSFTASDISPLRVPP